MRLRIAVLVLIALLPACATTSPPEPSAPPAFSIQELPLAASPSPELRLQVQSGAVRALIPQDWEARPLPSNRYPQEGFVASLRISDWERAEGTVGGIEAFWVDLGKLRIPSDYYYLVARGPAIGSLTGNKGCSSAEHEVFVDHPPDFTGRRFSPGDYAATATGTCRTKAGRTHWAYAVAAPGFGPARQVGIPNSGLYVIMAAMSGPKADLLLMEMIQSTRFGDTPLFQIMDAAGIPR